MTDIYLSKKSKIRIAVFLFIVLVFYGFSFFYLFVAHNILASIVYIFGLFIFFHFLSLDIKKIKKLYVFCAILLITIVGIWYLWTFNLDLNVFLICAILLLNMSLFFLFDWLRVLEFKSASYFLRWGYIFTLLITTAYSFALVWMFQKFPFTCEWLRSASNKMRVFIEKPFSFWSTKIVENQTWDSSIYTGSTLDDKIKNILSDVKDVNILVGSWNTLEPIIFQINQWKTDTIDQIVLQQESYSIKVCEILLEEINNKYGLKEFRLSVILLSYFLLFGFVRIAIFIISFVSFIIFKILYLFGLYKITKQTKEVNDIT